MAMAYSLHVGNDKNRKLSSKGITTKSGTTSLPNNGIQNKVQLMRCDKHNYRKYDMDQKDICIIKGTDSLVNDVQNLYHDKFDELVLEYNNKQTRSDRKIENYYEHVSLDKSRDLAVEIIIELGNKEFWDTKDENYKRKMTNVYKKQINDLELILPEFKICSAIIHYDETSPHMHVVGVPIKDGYKNGLSSQVCKSKVFNKASLIKLQDQMRLLCIKDYNDEYGLNEKLKSKNKGRNLDINVRDMDHYAEAKIVLDLESDKLDKINNESKKLDDESKNIKENIDSFKYNNLLNGYLIPAEVKDEIDDYIDKVNEQNQKYKEINNLKNIINLGYDNMQRLETVQDNNKALTIKVKALEKQVKEKDNKINELEKLVNHFKDVADNFRYLYYGIKDKFNNLIKLISNKLVNYKSKAKYKEFTGDLFSHGVLNYDDYNEIDNNMNKIRENNYSYSNKESKEKDDYEL